MSTDDKETSEPEEPTPEDRPKRKKALPPRVERALAQARAAAQADHRRKEGRWLAVFPIGVGLLLLLLMMPRATAPDAVPVPAIDARALAKIERGDDARAAEAEAAPLPGYILAVGGAFRVLNGLDVRGGDDVDRIDARRRLESATRDLPRGPNVEPELLSLRALQVRHFVDALARWEATGQVDDDLADLAGGFIDRAAEAGWVQPSPRRLLMGESARRVAFKTVWNSLVGVSARRAFALSLDEERALYAFYLEHPRPPEAHRLSLDAERDTATAPDACALYRADERRQASIWLADKIKRLGAIDPKYPTGYALGVAYYRAGRYDLSVDAFTTFLAAHPDGPYALRARNHLKAALAP